ncbi:MAG: hypothetical protein IPO62_17485 [Saprospiraceae bacterium]|nr:hypothetical protein [Saprospiraceae bacterium]MBK9632817.1 hypothetical protein [Saprospiraceae bacterium]
MSTIQIPSKDKNILLGMGAIGIISLISIIMNDDHSHTRLWTNLLHNSVFFTLIALMAVFFICISITAYAGWNVVFRRLWDGMAQFLHIGFVLMAIIALGIYFGWHHLYHWADPETAATDEIIKGKSGFLNKNFYTIVGLGILGTWLFFARKMRSLTLLEDDHGDDRWAHYKTMKFYAAMFLPIAGFTSAAVIWLWVMSVDPHWYSTMFAWYTGASCFVSMIALTILMLIYLKSKGYYKNVSDEHFHDLGKFMFAFSVFWTYLWFSQYMLIWYSNIGEETIYFKTRIREYPVLFYGNLVMNFVLPFLILIRNDTKRKYGTLIVVGIIVFFGHWVDLFQMINPGAYHTAHELGSHATAAADQVVAHADPNAAHDAHGSSFKVGVNIPGLPEIGVMIGFLALFVGTTLHFLSKAPLTPKKDPFLQESLHHHV